MLNMYSACDVIEEEQDVRRQASVERMIRVQRHNQPKLKSGSVGKRFAAILSGMRFENLEDEEFVLPRTEFRPEHEESVLEHGDFRELVFVTGAQPDWPLRKTARQKLPTVRVFRLNRNGKGHYEALRYCD